MTTTCLANVLFIASCSLIAASMPGWPAVFIIAAICFGLASHANSTDHD